MPDTDAHTQGMGLLSEYHDHQHDSFWHYHPIDTGLTTVPYENFSMLSKHKDDENAGHNPPAT